MFSFSKIVANAFLQNFHHFPKNVGLLIVFPIFKICSQIAKNVHVLFFSKFKKCLNFINCSHILKNVHVSKFCSTVWKYVRMSKFCFRIWKNVPVSRNLDGFLKKCVFRKCIFKNMFKNLFTMYFSIKIFVFFLIYLFFLVKFIFLVDLFCKFQISFRISKNVLILKFVH